jgi:hypothetical protein
MTSLDKGIVGEEGSSRNAGTTSAATAASPAAGHTAGPWFWAVDRNDQPTSLRQSGSGDCVINAQADISNYGLSVDPWMDVSEQDARLIAAAPDLLEALKAITEEVCDYARINNLGDPELKHNVRLARAALSKAEMGR